MSPTTTPAAIAGVLLLVLAGGSGGGLEVGRISELLITLVEEIGKSREFKVEVVPMLIELVMGGESASIPRNLTSPT
jgi:hypothetical protein